jgi:hypothetical protein
MSRYPGMQIRSSAEFAIIEGFVFLGGGFRFIVDNFHTFSDDIAVNGFSSYFINNADIYLYVSVGF